MRTALLLLAASCVRRDGEDTESKPAETAEDTATSAGVATTLLVRPYLQSMTTTDGWICWETDAGAGSVVEWGASDTLGSSATGTATVGGHGVQHEVQLQGLEPDTEYWYRVTTGDVRSEAAHFRTPPEVGAGKAFRLVAASDMQRDNAWPTKWAQVVDEGIVPYVTGAYDADLPAALGLLLIAGDLVDNGWAYDDWTDDFFGGAASLLSDVPVYPVLGNHEGGSPAYFQYFHLPDNGMPGYEEHWWTTDYANLRVIGLDSNTGYTLSEQLDWMDALLERTCTDDTIEFVFAEMHHPWRSELWPPGEIDYTGEVVSRLEQFTTRCGKPSIHFFGHTHAYSRGQSRDHKHLWVNVASGGGALDRWGSSAQVDYPEFSVSQDEYGFVVVEVEPGEFTLKRVSLGTPEAPRANEVTDEITVKVDATAPATPATVSAVVQTAATGTEVPTVTLQASPFSGADGALHGASWWQVSADCDTYSKPVVDAWIQHEDWYQGVDQLAGVDLTRWTGELGPGEWCWRVRYRDRGLMWSEWSEGGNIRVQVEG